MGKGHRILFSRHFVLQSYPQTIIGLVKVKQLIPGDTLGFSTSYHVQL